ncbi:MAG TPA: glycosyltransferase family 4 protein [Acidimicrobiia bacterium]|nr:glycosyltransferase family 4 protein [Acidimicrobiia bacterium]
MPTSPRPLPRPGDPLRVAYLVYRGNPHCGGQGVYSRHLTKELSDLGHTVEVFAGQPWPVLEPPVKLNEVASLDLYRKENPFRTPWPHEVRTLIDLQEFLLMCTAGFPEPYTFSLRARKMLQRRRHDFDLVHDNQCLGTGLLGMLDDGWPLVHTLHHPITVDRDLDLAAATNFHRRLTLRRWYGFLNMQMRVARSLPRHLTVSENSKKDIVKQMGVAEERLHIVPVGVDQTRFRPMPHVARVPGRLMTTASADVPLKGLTYLIDALAKIRTERPDAHLVVIGSPRHKSKIPAQIEQLGLTNSVQFVSGVSDERIVELYGEAEIAVVPSLYEGFSLPAIEAMACGTAVVATTGGALPEVVGEHGVSGMLVPTADPSALANQIVDVLEHPELRERIGEGGRRRVLDRFTWRKTAEGTQEHYWLELEAHARRRHDAEVADARPTTIRPDDDRAC